MALGICEWVKFFKWEKLRERKKTSNDFYYLSNGILKDTENFRFQIEQNRVQRNRLENKKIKS